MYDVERSHRLLKRAGFRLDRVRGSHHMFVKESRFVVVPHPRKDMPIGTVKAIEKQAGIKIR
ncbi:MAG: type II toxin-antitoxin system HicA family toxin [Myxococcales bacterium]|nr:type II toxin-antitoxin system HicA family toxin [Myxococcales bacterium]